MSEVPSDIEELVLGSEREVESKILISRLFNNLGYDDNDRAENYAVEWDEGGKKAKPKFADQVYFNGKKRNQDTSLIVAEAKSPHEKVDAQGQACFYSMWLRVPFYILCNGNEFVIIQMHLFHGDKILLQCKVAEIPENWAKIESILHKQNVIDYCNKNKLKTIKVGEVDVTEYLKNKIQQTQAIRASTVPLDVRECVHDEQFSTKVTLQNKDEDQSKERPLLNVANENKPLVILGEPGSGKTTSLNFLLNYYSNKAQSEENAQIPILVPLHQYNTNTKIQDLIQEELKPHVPHVSSQIIHQMLKAGKFCLLLDGLDEIGESLISEAINRVKRLLTDYAQNQIIVTCRKDDYHQQFSQIATTVGVEPLSDKKILEAMPEFISGRPKMAFLHSLSKGIHELIRNPLILSIVITIYEDPQRKVLSNRAQLYETFTVKLLKQWDLEKGIPERTKIPLEDKLEVLAHIAAEALPALPTYDRSLVMSIIKKNSGDNNPKELFSQLIHSGILAWNNRKVRFYHPTFQEYFVARALVIKCKKESPEAVFGSLIENHRLGQVFVFAAGLFDDLENRERFLDFILKKDISLYHKCIKAQVDLSENLLEMTQGNLARYYFSELHESYNTLIDWFFYPFRHGIDPWPCIRYHKKWAGKDVDEFKTGIVGLLSQENSRAVYAHKIMLKSDNSKVEIIQPPLDIEKREDIAHSRSRNLVFQGQELGIDSSRLISFENVKDEVAKLIENKKLIEDGVILLERVVDLLPRIAKGWGSTVQEFTELGLGKSHTQLINSLTKAADKKPRTQYHVHVTGVKTELVAPRDLAKKIKRLHNLGIKSFVPVLPKPDKSFPPGGTYVDVYSDEALKSRITRFFESVMLGYEQMVKNNFPRLEARFPLYK